LIDGWPAPKRLFRAGRGRGGGEQVGGKTFLVTIPVTSLIWIWNPDPVPQKKIGPDLH
jgi:hypothetical protein